MAEPTSPASTGVIWRPPARQLHECTPPMRCAIYRVRGDEPADDCWAPVFTGWRECTGLHDNHGCINGQAAEPVGTVWRCACGAYWTVWLQTNQPGSSIHIAYAPEWRRSTWWERRRARRKSCRSD